MTKIADYGKATNAAYEVLLKYNGYYPIIDIIELISTFNDIHIHTYLELAQRMSMSIIELLNFVPSEYGYTIYDTCKKRWLIFFNNTKDNSTVRFTLAHELGHIVLNHTIDDNVSKQEANCFARNVLCPLPIRNIFRLEKADEYCSCFGISEPMAEATIGRTSSDRFYITQENYNRLDEMLYCYFSGYTMAELHGYA